MRFLNFLYEGMKPEDKITQTDLNNLEKWADALWKKVGIDIEFTKHFLDQVNNKRNKKQITFGELTQIYRKSWKKYGFKIPTLGDGAEAVINDMKTDINIPFILDWDERSQEFDLIAKTVMRKKNFKTTNKKLRVG
jgi:hypothetical protein